MNRVPSLAASVWRATRQALPKELEPYRTLSACVNEKAFDTSGLYIRPLAPP